MLMVRWWRVARWTCRGSFCFFFVAASTTGIYTLSLHDALPIYNVVGDTYGLEVSGSYQLLDWWRLHAGDRKSTRLNSSHVRISYAVFCLKKKNDSCCRLFTSPVVARRARRGCRSPQSRAARACI